MTLTPGHRILHSLLRGRSQRGKPGIGSVPHGHWQNNTFIAGLRHDRIVAPMLIPGPMDGDAFVVWVERALAPTLGKGDIVICDKSLPEGAASTRTPPLARLVACFIGFDDWMIF